ncbi:MAG: MBL fold metallo-hydrolase [Bdellovibrionaceae bacterium]|jgi:glyoxylase-like metal-dependent hydrolase (beta-lactamase superfamily II)|nr:MBL fold metallo-hydrolase [Pseudobdellovibrionaceae bacterium]
MKPEVKAFFDKDTWTLTYVVFDPQSKDAVVVDPVWDYDPAASKVSRKSVDEVLRFISEKGLKLHYILETHAHADHLTGAKLIQQAYPQAKVAIGANITEVQGVFKKIYNFDDSYRTDGTQFDLLLKDGQEVKAGTLTIKTIATPGHTPACVSYLIGDAVFTGDALFMPDFGTGRCDFPAGSAEQLYHSIHEKLYKLPDETRVFVGHDYQPDGREVKWESTIGEEKKYNIQLNANTTKEQFVNFRKHRDAQLAAPKLLLPSIQVNVFGGVLPKPESNGVPYLKIPVRSA